VIAALEDFLIPHPIPERRDQRVRRASWPLTLDQAIYARSNGVEW
jgi:hypothetical protein